MAAAAEQASRPRSPRPTAAAATAANEVTTAMFAPDTADRWDRPVSTYACCSATDCRETSPSTMPGMSPCEAGPTFASTAAANVERTWSANAANPSGEPSTSTRPLSTNGFTPGTEDSLATPRATTCAPLTAPDGSSCVKTGVVEGLPGTRTRTRKAPEDVCFGAPLIVPTTSDAAADIPLRTAAVAVAAAPSPAVSSA